MTEGPPLTVCQDDPGLLVKEVGAKSVLTSAIWSYATQALTIFSGILLARILGPYDRGLLAAAMLWPTIFASFGLLGMPTALTIRIRRSAERVSEHTWEALRTSLAVGVVECVVLYFLLPYLIPESASQVVPWSRIFALVIPLSHLGWISGTVFTALGRFNTSGALSFFSTALYVVILALAWVRGAVTFSVALLAVVISKASSSILNTGLLATKVRLESAEGKMATLWREGYPYLTEQFAVGLVQQTIQWILLLMMTPTALGYYAISLAFAGLGGALSNSINVVLFLKFSGMDVGSNAKEYVSKTFRQSFLVQWFPAVVLVVVAPLVIPAVFGAPYRSSIFPALLLVPAMLVKAQTNLLLTVLRSTGKAIAGAALQLSPIIALTIVGYPTIRLWGVAGAASAFLFACMAEFCAVFYFVSRLGFPTAQFFRFSPRDVGEISLKLRNLRKSMMKSGL